MDMLETVQKLLNMAEDPHLTPEAARTYAEKATQLMIRYAIDEAMLQAQKIGQKDQIISDRVEIDNPYATSKVNLFANIAQNFRCRTILTQGWKHDGSRKTRTNVLTIVGYSQDVSKVKTLYASLIIQLFNAIQHTPVPSHEHGKTFRTSLSIGFTSMVWERLQALTKQAMQESSTGTDLVLFDRKKAVDMEVERTYPSLRPARHMSAKTSSGFAEGRNAGQLADIGLTGIGKNKKAIG